MLWRAVAVSNRATGRKQQAWLGVLGVFLPLYLSLGNVHEHGEAGHVVTLTADVAVVPVEHLTAFSGPAACSSDPKRTNAEEKKGTFKKENIYIL